MLRFADVWILLASVDRMCNDIIQPRSEAEEVARNDHIFRLDGMNRILCMSSRRIPITMVVWPILVKRAIFQNLNRQ